MHVGNTQATSCSNEQQLASRQKLNKSRAAACFISRFVRLSSMFLKDQRQHVESDKKTVARLSNKTIVNRQFAAELLMWTLGLLYGFLEVMVF